MMRLEGVPRRMGEREPDAITGRGGLHFYDQLPRARIERIFGTNPDGMGNATMDQIEITPMSVDLVDSFHRALDAVARERKVSRDPRGLLGRGHAGLHSEPSQDERPSGLRAN